MSRLILLLLLAGCATDIPKPAEREYREIPDAWLQECKLPLKPETEAELSDAFVQAYQCADQGNKDKRRIRDLMLR